MEQDPELTGREKGAGTGRGAQRGAGRPSPQAPTGGGQPSGSSKGLDLVREAGGRTAELDPGDQ